MIKIPVLIGFILTAFCLADAQLPDYEIDFVRDEFNGGQPLPAGIPFLITGKLTIPKHRIELDIYKRKKKRSVLRFQAVWKGAKHFNSADFSDA